jgi:hypothetical protein
MRATRLFGRPILSREACIESELGFGNVNGPSLIRTPEWLPNRLAKYYLYFASHRGRSIGLAYSDELDGPWKIYRDGCLRLSQALGCRDHIASPDVHIDDTTRQIRMFFHGVSNGSNLQFSYLALSTDGLSFVACIYPVAPSYLRVVRYQESWLGMSKGARMYRSLDGISNFKPIDCSIYENSADTDLNRPGNVRHVALALRDNLLKVFFTRIGDAPESIYFGNIDLSRATLMWHIEDEELLLSPETEYEGVKFPIRKSQAGQATQPQRGIRDPAYFYEAGRSYVLYSVAGEQGIAIAELEGM